MDLKGILQEEEDNRSHIFLHRVGRRWYAYERSAFLCSCLFGISGCRWLADAADGSVASLRVHIPCPGRFSCDPLLRLEGKQRRKYVIFCKVSLSGFRLWRQEMESRLSGRAGGCPHRDGCRKGGAVS